MHRIYNQYVSHTRTCATAEKYRTWLEWLFKGIEFVGTQWLRMNFSGYAAQQVVSTHYTNLLYELGEKYAGDGNGGWSVEIRLGIIVLINTVVYVVVQKMAGWLGPQVTKAACDQLSGIAAQGLGISQPNPQQADNNTAQGGFDIGSLLGMFQGFMGQPQQQQQAPAARQATYDE